MNIPKKITFHASFVLATLFAAATHPIRPAENTHDTTSLFNRVTVHYHSLAQRFPLAVEYKTRKWNEEFQMHQMVSEVDQKISRPIKNYLMHKERDKSSSLFSVHVPWSDKKEELLAAEDGDHYFVSYVATGKECYLSIGKENTRTGVTDYELCKIPLLTIPSSKVDI